MTKEDKFSGDDHDDEKKPIMAEVEIGEEDIKTAQDNGRMPRKFYAFILIY